MSRNGQARVIPDDSLSAGTFVAGVIAAIPNSYGFTGEFGGLHRSGLADPVVLATQVLPLALPLGCTEYVSESSADASRS